MSTDIVEIQIFAQIFEASLSMQSDSFHQVHYLVEIHAESEKPCVRFPDRSYFIHSLRTSLRAA